MKAISKLIYRKYEPETYLEPSPTSTMELVGNRSTRKNITLCFKSSIFHKCHKISISNLEMLSASQHFTDYLGGYAQTYNRIRLSLSAVNRMKIKSYIRKALVMGNQKVFLALTKAHFMVSLLHFTVSAFFNALILSV